MPSNEFYESIRLHRFTMLMHPLQERDMGEPACGRPRSIRGLQPLTEPAEAVSAFGDDRLSLASGTGSTGPLKQTRGIPSRTRPAGRRIWTRPLTGARVYLSDGPVYWPLPSPQGLRGASNFQPPP